MMAAATASIPVHVSGFTWTAALVGILNMLVGGALVAFIRSLPTLKKIANEREQAIGQREDEKAEKIDFRISALETKVEKANEDASIAKDQATVVRMQMISMQAAFELVAGELERADPDNPVLQQARRLLAQAATSDMGVGTGIRKLVNKLGGIE